MSNQFGDFGENIDVVESYAKNILAMEDSYDSSMRGGFLKRLLNEYIRLYSERIVNMFDVIYNKQENSSAYYGDDDVTVTKITVKNDIIGRGEKSKVADRYDYEFRSLLFTDNCGFGGSVVMCEVIRTHKEHRGIVDKFYHIRSVSNREVDKVSLFKMSDVKEETYIVSYVYDICEQWRIERDIDMTTFYEKWKMFINTINVPFYYLNQ